MVAPAPFDPIEARKEKLMADPGFSKFVRIYKNKVPLNAIRNQMRAVSIYDPYDILMFILPSDIANLKNLVTIKEINIENMLYAIYNLYSYIINLS